MQYLSGRAFGRVTLIFATMLSLSACRYGSPVASGDNLNGNLTVEAKSPGVLKRYNSFFIQDIGVYSIEGDYLRRVEDSEVRNLAEEFRAKLIRSLGDQYTTIPQRTGNTAGIKIALTDVTTSYGVFQVLPGVAVPNAMRGGASIDATIFDSVTLQPLVHVRDSRQGERQGFFSGLRKYDGAQRAFEEWAQALADAVRN
jgi:hypothetical protein